MPTIITCVNCMPHDHNVCAFKEISITESLGIIVRPAFILLDLSNHLFLS